jgi:putative flippase GtrA
MMRATEGRGATLRTGVRYVVVGILGTLAHFTTTVALVEGLSVDPVVATVLGFIVALVLSFVLVRGWVFGSSAAVARTFPRYVMVSVAGLLLNALIMHVTVDVVRVSYLWGLCAVVLVVPAFNFTLNRTWTFS